MGKIGAFVERFAGRGIAGVFLLKGATIVLSFVLITLASRVLGAETFGTYSVLFSAVGLLCIVATFGQQVLLMRSWNEYVAANDPGHLKGAIVFGVTACLGGAAAMAVACYVWVASVEGELLGLAVSAYLVSLALVLTSSHLVRTAISVGAGDGYGNLLTILPPITYLGLCWLLGWPASLSAVYLLFTAGALLALIIHLAMICRKVMSLFPGFGAVRAQYDPRRWTARSLKLWVSNALEASNQYLDVLVIGYLMTPSVAGAYFVITRLANAFAVMADAMHMFSTRHIPDLYYRGELQQLGKLLNSVARITLLISMAGLLGVVLCGEALLKIFNADYAVYYPALAVLCLGTAAVGAVGPSGSILMFTGHEGRYLRIIASTVALRFVAFMVLIPTFGILGAAVATSASFLFMAISLRHSAKALTSIDGSVLRLLSPRGKASLPVTN